MSKTPIPVDLAREAMDSFDDVLCNLEWVVNASGSLALDDARDRRTLVVRLQVALGAVPDETELADPVARALWQAWLRHNGGRP